MEVIKLKRTYNMTDIPPVEERQVRACADPRNECVFYRFDEGNGHWCTQKLGKGIEWRWGNPIKPCIYHLTPEELTAWMNQHNAREQLVRLIELRIDDLDGQLSEGEIKLPLHHALTCELRWILQLIEDFEQQPRQDGQDAWNESNIQS